jgi:hypothetical protein
MIIEQRTSRTKSKLQSKQVLKVSTHILRQLFVRRLVLVGQEGPPVAENLRDRSATRKRFMSSDGSAGRRIGSLPVLQVRIFLAHESAMALAKY